MKLAIVGATGMVGRQFLKIIQEKKLHFSSIKLFASKKSINKKIRHNNKELTVNSMDNLLLEHFDFALFSAGSDISRKWAPKLAEKGCRIVDNSSCWRMSKKHKLIVPEINGNTLTKDDFIIANPNCSTIQLLMVLYPLHEKYKIERVVVSTYQSVSGTGNKAVLQLQRESKEQPAKMVYSHPIYNNLIPQCDVFDRGGYTKEELKIVNETKKILDKKIKLTATAVRVPVHRCHSESVNISFFKEFQLEELKKGLKKTSGVTLVDEPKKNKYPTPLSALGRDEVFVGRIRRDETYKNSLNLWIVGDNLRKGAATNSVQIIEYLISNTLKNN